MGRECFTFNDLVIKKDAMNTSLIQLAVPDLSFLTYGYLDILTWTVQNIYCNKNPPPSLDTVQKIHPTLVHLLHCDCLEVLRNIC